MFQFVCARFCFTPKRTMASPSAEAHLTILCYIKDIWEYYFVLYKRFFLKRIYIYFKFGPLITLK